MKLLPPKKGLALLSSCLLCLSIQSTLKAETQPVHIQNRDIQPTLSDAERFQDHKAEQIPVNKLKNLPHQAISISLKSLQENKGLLEVALTDAAKRMDAKSLQVLLPIFSVKINKQNKNDILLYIWAKAIILADQRDFKPSLDYFAVLRKQVPGFNILFLQEQYILLGNKNYYQVKKNIEALSTSDKDNPNVKELLEIIDNKQKLNSYFSFFINQDKNINGVPKDVVAVGGFSSEKRVSSFGLNYSAGLSKYFILAPQLSALLSTNLYGVEYFSAKKYSNATARFETGLEYENGWGGVGLKPFVEQTFYREIYDNTAIPTDSYHRYLLTKGVQLNTWFNPTTRIKNNFSLEYARQNYQYRQYLNGYYYELKDNLYYFFDNFYLRGGVKYLNQHSIYAVNEYIRREVNAGIGVNLPYQLFFKTDLSFADKRYKGKYVLIDQNRKDKIYGLYSSLSKKDFKIFGLYPTMNLQYIKNKSNVVFNSYDKFSVFFSLERSF
ncbi:hypothetical protein CEP45_00480 [Mergibacter septicus]|uniref:surface lipoprotein assembly modifier n=1 Tax=Mergibacter septicus TaxID=221402 RepID=UPI001C78F67B|nr:surface lipoprotein assembly modifier [Mergibacter septicus]QDJ12418.1 hypothetical protein CEP45_00480 [Mergibacter septicus]